VHCVEITKEKTQKEQKGEPTTEKQVVIGTRAACGVQTQGSRNDGSGRLGRNWVTNVLDQSSTR
jgi:hypothetical protein